MNNAFTEPTEQVKGAMDALTAMRIRRELRNDGYRVTANEYPPGTWTISAYEQTPTRTLRTINAQPLRVSTGA